MGTDNRSFQLESMYPGMFLLQGWLGGILAGYITVVCICLFNHDMGWLGAFFFLSPLVIVGSVLAIVKATIFWALYRLTGIQMGAALRAVASSIAAGLFALFTAHLFNVVEPKDLAAWVGTLLVAAMPTPLLVGSNVKPWELCTFGSMALNATGERVGSTSVLATLGTLPLRFLSLGALAIWILAFVLLPASETSMPVIAAALGLTLIYLLFSAYVSFRSPRKNVVLATGIAVNLPIAALAAWSYSNHTYTDWLFIGVICTAFVVAWIVFLAARLSVRTHRVRITGLTHALIKAHNERDHDCLGSRFLEWQQRIA